MSTKKRPTVVVNGIEYDGGQEGYRVILSDGADIFGEDGEHVAETIAETDEEVSDAILRCKLALQGWDAIEGADLEWLWGNRPERIGKSSYHLSQAILEDVRAPLPPTETVTSGDSDDECIENYTPSTDAEGGKEIDHLDGSDVSAYGEKSTRIREDTDESIRIGQDDCHHLPEYKFDGECLRCDLERQGEQDRAVKRELTADSGGQS